MDVLVSGVATPSRPLVALVDTGLGNGGNVLTDIADARIMRPTRCPLGACSVVPLSGIPDAWAAGASNGDHGTAVAHLAAGAGQRILGTGKDIAIRPIKASGNMDPRRYTQGLQVAAADAAVRVIVLEYQTGWYDFNHDGAVTNIFVAQPSGPANELQTAVNALNNARPHWLPAINALLVANPTKILVIPAGNASQNTAFSILAPPQATAFGNIGGLFNAPTRGGRVAGAANSLVMGIGNATLTAMPLGQEQRDSDSNFGPQISVTSLSQNVPSLDPSQNFRFFGGTSGAAPQVAGLAGELIYLDDNLATVGPFSSLQIVELIEATADDLGNSSATAALLNNNPGDGSDNTFGHGRINAWKATLSAVNGGVAEESHPAGSGFGSLTRKNEANTKWYGFKIHSPIRRATVWVDGVQVTDAGATAPGGITAYAGVSTNTIMQIGVKDDADAILDEDPTTGIVPAGSQSNYIATFSIERSDLVKAGGNKVLTVRIPGWNDPYLNLELNLKEMRKGKIPGVTFDDFVFEITPPDFGDAIGGYPSSLADNGARHLHSGLEWFGGPSTAIDGVSPEFGVWDDHDPDGIGNWGNELADLDGLDNGVVFFPLTYTPGGKGIVEFEVCVGEESDRYSAATQDQQLFVNGWIDWNTNGNWQDAANEHIVDGLRLAPINAASWSPFNAMPMPNGTTVALKLVLANCGIYKATFDVPASIGTGKLWSRFRLDYGENVGRHNNSLFKKHTELSLTRGPAHYGEVEDYLIGSDFGDAGKDPPYQTRLSRNGPRHLQIYREWIGPYQAGESSATREPDACGVGSADQDGGGNLTSDCNGLDADKKDDFRVFVPTPGKFIVEFEVSSTVRGYGFNGGHGGVATMKPDCSLLPMAATPGSPAHQTSDMRYDAGTANERLYVNLWADWEGDGSWDTHLIPGLPVDPEDFGADGKYTLGEPFTDSNGDGVWNDGETYTDVAGTPSRFFSCLFDGFPPLGLRLRLDYGENAGALGVPRIGDPFEEFPIHSPVGPLGGAVWGEVEDKVGLPGVPHIEIPPLDIPLGVPVTTGPVDTAILPGSGPYSFHVVEQTIPGDMPNTPLPDGLSIDANTGEISGETLVPGITWPLIWVFDTSSETPELIAELWQHLRVPLHLTTVKVDADTMQPRQGTSMTLYRGGGCTSTPLQIKTTDESGMIWFDDLDPEVYSVQDTEEPGRTPLTPPCQDIDLTNFQGVSALPIFTDSYPVAGSDRMRAAAGLWLQTSQGETAFTANGIMDVLRGDPGDTNGNLHNDIEVQIIGVDMVGDSTLGPMQLGVNPTSTTPSLGLIEELLIDSFFPANAGFNAFLDLETANGTLTNPQPLFLQAQPQLNQLPLAGASFGGGGADLDDEQGQSAGQIIRMLLVPLSQDEAGLVFMTIPEN